MIEQKTFSRLIVEFLENSLPEFCSTIKYQDNGSCDCKLRNPSGKFAIWIATYGSEITYGLEAPNGLTDIHTHISCYETDDLDECLSTLNKEINKIISNKVILYLNERKVYNWIEFTRLKEIEKQKGIIFQKFFWSESI